MLWCFIWHIRLYSSDPDLSCGRTTDRQTDDRTDGRTDEGIPWGPRGPKCINIHNCQLKRYPPLKTRHPPHPRGWRLHLASSHWESLPNGCRPGRTLIWSTLIYLAFPLLRLQTDFLEFQSTDKCQGNHSTLTLTRSDKSLRWKFQNIVWYLCPPIPLLSLTQNFLSSCLFSCHIGESVVMRAPQFLFIIQTIVFVCTNVIFSATLAN